MRRRRYYDDDDDFFHPGKPIETDQGIKAKTKRGAFTKNWWAERWIAALEGLLDPGRLRRVADEAFRRNEGVVDMDVCARGLVAEMLAGIDQLRRSGPNS